MVPFRSNIEGKERDGGEGKKEGENMQKTPDALSSFEKTALGNTDFYHSLLGRRRGGESKLGRKKGLLSRPQN